MAPNKPTGKKINMAKFLGRVEEITIQGSLDGHQLTREERKEGFKKKNDPIEFSKFVSNVLAKKRESLQPSIEELKSSPSQKLLPGTAEPTTSQRMESAFDSRLDDILKDIRENTTSILSVIKTQTEVDEDLSDEDRQESELAKRNKKEQDKEKASKGKRIKVPLVSKFMAPVTSIWDDILGTFGILLAGWGLDKLMKWFGDKKNKQAIEDLKEFIKVTLPPILKGILALVALDIGLKLIGFTASIIKGSIALLGGLKGLFVKTMAAISTNPWLAATLGITAVGVGIGLMQRKGEENLGEVTGDTGFTANTFGSGLAVPVNPSPNTNSPSHGRNPFESLFNKGGLVTPPVQKLSTGGFVSGPEGPDRVPAKLTAGEFVMSKGAVQRYGTDTMESMNAAGGGKNNGSTLKGFNEGGEVKGPSSGGFGMTAKKGFIGSDAKENRFIGPKKEAYFLQIKKKTGEVEIWNEEFGSDKYIGSMDPNTKRIDFNKSWWGGAKPFEVDFFSQLKNKDMVMQKAQGLIRASSSAGEINSQTANMLINNPPGKSSKGGDGTLAMSAPAGGKGSGETSGARPPSFFEAMDKSNLTTLFIKSMYGVVG